MGNLVGPALAAAGGRVALVVSAIRDDNPGPGLEVVDSGSYLLVLAPHVLRATTKSLRWHLGRGFGLGELEAMVLASVGCMQRSGHAITWQSGDAPRADAETVEPLAVGDAEAR